MAAELEVDYLTGLNVYFQIRNATGSIWRTDTNVMEAYTTANIANYNTNATEQGTASAFYTATFPSQITAGIYNVVAKQRVGGAVAESDPSVGWGDVNWDGTNIIPLSNVPVASKITSMFATLLQTDITGAIEQAAAIHSLAGIIMKLTCRFKLNTGAGATADTFRTDGVKKFSQTITTNSALVATQELANAS